MGCGGLARRPAAPIPGRVICWIPYPPLFPTSLKPGVPPEEWIFDEPEKVLALHRAFADAGADIILTNTFGGTNIRMRDSKYEGRGPELNRRAVELAREATSHCEGVLIAGSMGPTGSLFQPFGPLVEEQVVETYAEQAAALTEGGVDFLLLETMFAIDEALAAIEEANPDTLQDVLKNINFNRKIGKKTMGANVAANTPTINVNALAREMIRSIS